MKLSNVRQLIAEDFSPEDREMISRLGSVLNYFMRQVVELSDENIDFDNLVWDIVSFSVTVDANGLPLQETRFRCDVNSPRGLQVIKAVNTTNSLTYPSSQPFISYTPQGGNIIKVNHVSGLQADNTYQFTVIAF